MDLESLAPWYCLYVFKIVGVMLRVVVVKCLSVVMATRSLLSLRNIVFASLRLGVLVVA